ncbi:TetR family transcriptional regulator [Limnobacter humi]|uniref:TetR family transcriptional regulator n=1 Tax=Limnobacter humi TaxID=1778671 RepID=A0ABT1WDB9_9BURK|nr:TetR family transcriptional regulator [Limnobacter humi]
MVRKTKEEAQETRHQILDAAETVFSEKGVSRTTLNDIAQAAELTRGAIYWHFKNKADLLDAMMRRVTLPMDEFLATADADPEVSPLNYIRERTLHVVRVLAESPQTQRVFDIVMHKTELVDDMLPIRDQHLEARQGCISDIQGDIERAIRKGELPAALNALQAAIGIHSLIDGLFANWVLNPNFDLVQQAMFDIDNYLHGLKHRC